MVISEKQTCAHCGYENGEEAVSCGLCGELCQAPSRPTPLPGLGEALEEEGLWSEPRPFSGSGSGSGSRSGSGPGSWPGPLSESRSRGADGDARAWRLPWFYLAIGFLLAPALQLTQITGFMGWFLLSLPHEMGHSLFACYVGMPAYPAISLEGHAAAFHQPQIFALAILIWASLAGTAYAMRKRPLARILLGIAVLSYPLLAFVETPRELMHLLGGHIGELAFATVCFWRTLSGGFTQSRAERGLYALLAWHLLGQNLWLCWGLMTSATARATYLGNGSFGMANDYIRIAENVLHWPLPSVAALMFAASLCVLPLSYLIWRLHPE